jgi:hypothetical protein
MTPDEYVADIQRLGRLGAYREMLDLAQTVGIALEERLSAKHVRLLEPPLEHAALVLAGQRSRVLDTT